ncbi:MAG: uncharacterized protein K0S79_444 [Nitrospira sp.]|nr:uncharacterized protein [Nitrospira sp.]
MTLKNGLSEELNRQGNAHFGRGHYTEAYTCYAKALECDRLTGDQRALAATLGNLGNICAVSGRREAAQNYYQEVLELQKIFGDEKGIGTTLANLGNLRADAGEWDRARAYYLEALDLMTKTHDEAAKALVVRPASLLPNAHRMNCVPVERGMFLPTAMRRWSDSRKRRNCSSVLWRWTASIICRSSKRTRNGSRVSANGFPPGNRRLPLVRSLTDE